MNEMLEQLKIDPEFEKVIPPLTKDEYHQLEENILDDGRIMMPIAVWGDIIVDGHNRYRIACEYGDIPFSTTQLDFANRYEVIAWICKNQLGRRNLSDEQKTYLLGLANMFIDGINNYFTRFPKLRLDPAYIPRTLEVIEAVHDYLEDVKKDLLDALEESKTFDEGERKSQENTPDSNEALPQINTDL